MTKYYNPQRTRNLYNPDSKEAFRLSRSNIDLFLNCPRCFYLDRRLGVGRPPGYPFALNSAVDELLKREFDVHRANGTQHPLQRQYGVDAVPLAHEKIDEWRDALRRGVSFHHEETNFRITGGIDDVWVKPDGELLVVDYKATSKKEEVNLDADWQIGYKRQMEVYQWLFRRNGFQVSDTGYFVYCNGNNDAEAFDGKLEFEVKIIPYEGDDKWVEGAIIDAHTCLCQDAIPTPGVDCDHCAYRAAVQRAESGVT